MILVTGASGQVGIHLIRALNAKGISIRAWIHNEKNKESVTQAGATEVFVGDMASLNDAKEAMKGIQLFHQ